MKMKRVIHMVKIMIMRRIEVILKDRMITLMNNQIVDQEVIIEDKRQEDGEGEEEEDEAEDVVEVSEIIIMIKNLSLK